MKPFRPPTLVAKTPSNTQHHSNAVYRGEPPAKRQRTSSSEQDDEDGRHATAVAANTLKQPRPRTTFQSHVVKKPLNEQSGNSGPANTTVGGYEGYYNVLWRKFTTKKNKTWDGDGVLSVVDGYAILQDISGKELGRTACKGPLMIGSGLSVSSREVEVDSMISKDDFLAGRPFLGTSKKASHPTPNLKKVDSMKSLTTKAQAKHSKITAGQKERQTPVITASASIRNGFKTPLQNGLSQVPKSIQQIPIPRHDPKAPDALIMKRPDSAPKGKQIVDVVVDPVLTRALREHQRNGVAFLYECVMGLKSHSGEGAILADEMGLGKTLQTIALIWTLMKQNPIYEEAPVVRKALIVCPVTLINNWRKEFHKWLGKERIGLFVMDDTTGKNRMRITDFTKGKAYQVMIVGYEKLRTIADDLSKTPGGIDIVIADEGHRMKTAQNKSAAAIKQLNTDRRIILSGTPIQNDLTEFWNMVDFVNPGLLGKYNVFKREFETPILRSQQPGASGKDLEKGEARSEELASITEKFILRRTAEILSKYLPPKTEYVLFCQPTKAQAEVYRTIIGSPTFNAALGNGNTALELITLLKKVCNSPTLLLKNNNCGEESVKPSLIETVRPSLLRTPGASCKLQVLDSLLHQIRTTTDEKVVIVSNYTSTLNILQQLLTSLGYDFFRLDGSTPPAKRQDMVDKFNRTRPSAVLPFSFTGGKSQNDAFVFLLSAKAGGVGINLIGASRLVLFDLDWNPATDLQAMARVHRDGQKRPCFIYRFLVRGALDEKIFQRQVSKTGLADSIVDGKNGASGFTREELRDLFRLDERESGCQTHELLQCRCGGNGTPAPTIDVTEDGDLPTQATRNDLALLSASNSSSNRSTPAFDDSGVEILDLQDSDADSYVGPIRKLQYTTGSKVNMAKQEAEVSRRARASRDSAGKAKMLSLMQYSHFSVDRAHLDDADVVEQAVEDTCLRAVLNEDGGRVKFLMAKVSS
ncbi:hypothetical protein K431DRAFT_233479 [Polychaeton citri CBS 116435]|uniref:Uncharacterized protein n=1 Tax=Polychaeton citri CBS 116435 TaxID=1314669 RepID=A0A9P4Q0R6_9PEZI|nr:hypothetical protein K431DRAFT_233479 [Polychaeton citri CBS 116435]